MKITIRQERSTDHSSVFKVVESAFQTLEFSDHKEQFLVEEVFYQCKKNKFNKNNIKHDQ